jgi:hypothetical protein
VNLNAGSGANTINVNSTAPGTGTTVNANGGADTINVGPSSATVLTVNGGDANDVVNLDNPAGLANIVIFNGNASTGSGDMLNYNAQNRTSDDIYTINSGSIDRTGAVTVFFGTFENVTVHAGQRDDSFDVETTAAGTTYTMNGGPGSDALDVTHAAGNLGNADGAIVFNGDADADTATLWDNVSTANDSYSINGNQITRTSFGGLTWTTTEGVALNCSSGANVVNINSTLAGCTITINGNNGSDAFNLSTGDFDNQILGDVTLNGGIGTELAFVSDTADMVGFDTYTFQDNTMHKLTGGTITWNTVETVQVNGSNNSDLYQLLSNAAGVSLILDGNNGNDQFQLGAVTTGNLNSLPGPITLNGLSGSNDTVTVHDSGSTASDSYTLSPTQLTHPSFGGVTYSGIEGITLNCASGNNTLDLRTAASCPVAVNAANGTDTINVNETPAGAAVSIEPSTGNDNVNVNPDATGSASAIFNATQRIGAMTIGAGGSATIGAGANKVLTMSSVAISGSGALNATDNDIIIDYTGASPLNVIRNLLAAGYNAGAWNGGGGINSSAAAANAQHNTALGYAESSAIFTSFPATFSGQSVDSTAILIKYTAYGDANLDGSVNLSDFNRLASSFGLSGRNWSQGDFDFDGDVDLSDFNRLASDFGLSGF